MPAGNMQADRLLIVNADDLGRTPGINAGIFEAHRRGLVTSATLMVGFPAAVAAATEWAAHPELGVGLHVTFSGGGAPTLPPGQVPSLVDEEGRLPPRPERLAGADPGEVLAEVRSQVRRFRELTGRSPTHLDSHHHAHRLPVVLEAVVAVAREEGLPVRNASPAVRERLRAAGVATTDAFVERFFGDEARLDVLAEILGAIGPGVTELMCHPAKVDDELREGSSYVEDRERELAVLTDPEARRMVEAAGLCLVRFGAR
jgi:predicted glycoside hydrolase/deacetylase ChbG (UPF0249 family)